jgi:hypothetical protein
MRESPGIDGRDRGLAEADVVWTAVNIEDVRQCPQRHQSDPKSTGGEHIGGLVRQPGRRQREDVGQGNEAAIMYRNEVPIAYPELDIRCSRVVSVLDDLGESLEPIVRERFRTRSGTIESVFEHAWRLLEESGELLDCRPRLGFIPGLEIDRRPGIIEEELRRLFRCEASVAGWRKTTVSAPALGSDPGDGHSASVGLAYDNPKHRWRTGASDLAAANRS